MLFQSGADGVEVVGVLVELLVEVLPRLAVVDVHADLHPAVGGAVMVAPDAGGVLFFKRKDVFAQHVLVLIGRVHIEQEHTAFFHKETGVGDGFVQVRDVVEGVEGGHRTPDGAVEVELEQVLPQKKQAAGKAQLLSLVPDDAEHLLRLVDADHIVARLREHQGQLSCPAAQVCEDAVMDAVGFQLFFDVGIQGLVVGLAVELIVKISKFVVSHCVTPRPLRLPRTRRRQLRSAQPAAP